MSRPQRPSELSRHERQKRLNYLSKRSRILDDCLKRRNSKIGVSTIASFIPVVGGITTSIEAHGFVEEILVQFVIPTNLLDEMNHNVQRHLCMSLIPVYGWVARSVFRVNRRNYKLLQSYVKESKSLPTEKKRSHL